MTQMEAMAMPFKPSERQYRNIPVANFRALKGEDGDQSYKVRGYFTTFGEEYALMSDWFEKVDERALDDADMMDVIFLLNHEGAPFARQRNGSLRVGIDSHGGWCEADLYGCRDGRDLYESIKNGLIDEMSFGFIIADDGLEWDEDEDGAIHSTITRISKVFDVSAVSIPANPGTEISARSYLDGAIEARRKQQEVLRRAEDMRQRKAAAAERLKGLSLL